MHVRTALVLLFTVVVGLPASAQIPISRRVVSRVEDGIDPTTRLLVANGYAEGGVKPDQALQVSNAMRNSLAHLLGNRLTIVQASVMARALKHFGYGPEEGLPPSNVGALADQLRAANYVAVTVKSVDGRLTAVASISGRNEVSVAATGGQSAVSLGEALASLVKSGM